VLPDEFLDRREVVPPASAWVNRATLPPSRRHALLVWGRPGEVHGYVDIGPAREDDLDAAVTGEVRELYVDPSSQRRGGGALLLGAAIERLDAAGLSDHRLWVMAANAAGQAFYVAQGWAPDGSTKRVDLGTFAVEERRYRHG
jgi:GNAT superfamily N-acetyltransferase